MRKSEFYKLCKNNNGYFLAKGEGIKKTFEYEGEEIVIYFEKTGKIWEATEERTGLNVCVIAKNYKEAVSQTYEILHAIFINLKGKKGKECADILSKLKLELEDKNEKNV